MGTHKPDRHDEWTIEAIKDGLTRFHAEHGHFPTAPEIDKCPYLCTSRTIQLKFGGLRRLRKELKLDIVDYGKGDNRSKIGIRVNAQCVATENMVKDFLIDTYGEICVHEEKKFGKSRQRVDFFVYAKENFAVEVFNTYTSHDLTDNLNHKLPRYQDFPHKLYFVVTGGDFSQDYLDKLMANKKNKLMHNMKCLPWGEFINECQQHLAPIRINSKYKRTHGRML